MPDITMCAANECPKKYECYRYLAEPGRRQSYFSEPKFNENGCAHFWDTKIKPEFRRLETQTKREGRDE